MFIECKDCIHNMKCPCGWSYACAACLTIQKQYEENIGKITKEKAIDMINNDIKN